MYQFFRIGPTVVCYRMQSLEVFCLVSLQRASLVRSQVVTKVHKNKKAGERLQVTFRYGAKTNWRNIIKLHRK